MLPPVVDAAWVRAHRREVVLVDVRWYPDGSPGRAAYEREHLPGAVYADLDTQLAGPASDDAGRHPLPTPEAFARALGELGIAAGDTVIGYDDSGGVIAARLVWMLRAIGTDAALLDGGLAAWKTPPENGSTEPGSTESGVTTRPAVAVSPRPWPPGLLADLDDVTDRRHAVLDARPRGRYEGEPDHLDPVAGHIPGSRSLPAREHLAPDGRLLPVADLRARFAAVGVTSADGVVSSCGSGVTACHNLLVLEHAGLGQGRLFPGSWSRYCRTGLPVVTGSRPG